MTDSLLVGALLGVGFINALLAVSVFNRSSRLTGRWSFLILILGTSAWSWGVALFLVATSADYAQFYANGYYAAALLIGSGLVVFGRYVNGRTSRATTALWFTPPVVFIALVMTDPQWLSKVNYVGGDLNGRVTLDPVHYLIYSFVFLLIFVIGWVSLLSKTGSKRQQRRQRVVSVGIAVSGIFGIFFNLVLPGLGNYNFIPIGPLFSILFSLSITYAISRYSLFDLRRNFIASLSYLMASTTAALLYIGVMWSAASGITSGTSNQIVLGVVYTSLALIVAMTINPLREYFDRITAKLFLHERYQPEAALDAFGDAILNDVDASSITEKVIHAIDEVVHPTFSAVVLVDKDDVTKIYSVDASLRSKEPVLSGLLIEFSDATTLQQTVSVEEMKRRSESRRRLNARGVGVVARMQLKDQLIGYIVLGEKRNGDAYTTSETLMLSTMADESALATVNSLRFDEIEKFNVRLKKEVTGATRELRSSNKKLIEMDATKDEFVSMASHQLRTPLTSVKGYISMVLEGDAGKISDQQRQLLEEAFASSERMVHLIGDFLNVSRLQTGKFIVDRHEVDLVKIVEQEVEGIRQIAASHDIKLSYTHAPRVPTLYLDEGKIRQVVMNFIDNAVYYSSGGTSIKISLDVEDGEVVYRVIDKGMGVPDEVKSHLFTRFFRAENARKQRPDGTGIGLYLAKKIIDGHNGNVVFESVLGKGSTFGFRLPIKKLSTPPTVMLGE
jgi:signal transduction histidine kinase